MPSVAGGLQETSASFLKDEWYHPSRSFAVFLCAATCNQDTETSNKSEDRRVMIKKSYLGVKCLNSSDWKHSVISTSTTTINNTELQYRYRDRYVNSTWRIRRPSHCSIKDSWNTMEVPLKQAWVFRGKSPRWQRLSDVKENTTLPRSRNIVKAVSIFSSWNTFRNAFWLIAADKIFCLVVF